MTKAIVLSGAGARGAFQAGVLSQLSATDYDAAYGASSGGLNAAMFSYLTTEELLAEWGMIESINSVYQFNGFEAITLPGIYNNSPLLDLAQTVIDNHAPKIPVTVPVTDLDAGKTIYHTVLPLPQASDADFPQAVADGATIPALCCDLNALNLVDGGVLVNLPMEKALQDGHSDITLILAIPFGPGYEPNYNALKEFGASINAAVRSMDLLLNAQIWSTIMALSPQCKSLTVYAPTNDSVLGNPLDFSPANISAQIQLGQSTKPIGGLTRLPYIKGS